MVEGGEAVVDCSCSELVHWLTGSGGFEIAVLEGPLEKIHDIPFSFFLRLILIPSSITVMFREVELKLSQVEIGTQSNLRLMLNWARLS